jgi:hypothetical protein
VRGILVCSVCALNIGATWCISCDVHGILVRSVCALNIGGVRCRA